MKNLLEQGIERYRVANGMPMRLSDWDPNEKVLFDGKKKEGKAALPALHHRLKVLQERLYAEGKHRVLIVLQAMDTGGKDGTIRHIFERVNPQGVNVASFKKPTQEELSHDFLWRIHPHVPGNGEIVVFNRSHYEDVLIVRVNNLVPPEVWQSRYEHINAFEKMLVDEGTTILKFYLHIDEDEQKERLQSRLDDPRKHWKFDGADLAARKLWPEYTAAYEDMLNKTSTAWAPWYVIPANRKWYRNLVVSQITIQTLESLEMQYPEPAPNLESVVIE